MGTSPLQISPFAPNILLAFSPPFLTKDSFWGFEGTLLNRLLLYIHIAIIRKSTYDFLYRSTADLQYCVSFSLQQSDSDIYICFP